MFGAMVRALTGVRGARRVIRAAKWDVCWFLFGASPSPCPHATCRGLNNCMNIP